MATLKTLTINGVTYTVAPPVTVSSVTLLASAWVGENSSYSQVVAVPGAGKLSQLDLKPSVEQLEIFQSKNVTFTSENEDGIVTVYAVGDKPTNDYTIQVSVTEVTA